MLPSLPVLAMPWRAERDPNAKMLYSFLRKGVPFGCVERNYNLKDLKDSPVTLTVRDCLYERESVSPSSLACTGARWKAGMVPYTLYP